MAARMPIPITPEAFLGKKKRPEEAATEEVGEFDYSADPYTVEEDNEEGEESEGRRTGGGGEGDGEGGEGGETDAERKRREAEEEEEWQRLGLEEHAFIVMAILKPVAITMLITVFCVYALNLSSKAPQQVGFLIHEHSSDSTAQKAVGSIINAVVFVIMIVIVTFVLVALYYFRCMKVIFGWLILSVAVLLGSFGGALVVELCESFMIPLDWVTISMFVWNFIVVGVVSIFFGYAPGKFTQGYLIAISALLAVFFSMFPQWTTWALLVAIAIYDLFAVLCPKGPLQMLVRLSQERNEPIPALLYNGTISFMAGYDDADADLACDTNNMDISPAAMSMDDVDDVGMDDVAVDDGDVDEEAGADAPLLQDDGHAEEEQRPRRPRRIIDPEDILDYNEAESGLRSVKLGLGDFVFYSVLMGRAALYDITTVFTCFIAIITGLFCTLLLLAIFKRALPALPFSIFLGLFFFLLTQAFLVPYVLALGTSGIIV